MTTPSTLAEWLAHCERLHPKTIDLSLERVQRVRARLSVDFACPVFTVAGTNGKGSTCAMLEAILRASGYRVGVYTSPHLVHFEERCRVDGEMIEAAQLLPHFAAARYASYCPLYCVTRPSRTSITLLATRRVKWRS